MTILQSTLAQGQTIAPQAFGAGVNVSVLATFTIPTGMTVATTDIIELSVLPAGCHIVDAIILPTGSFGAAVTADVGIMSGTFGDAKSVRTSGDEVFDAVTLTALGRLSDQDALFVAPTEAHRGIGVKFSDAITGAGQVIGLQLTYAQ